MDPLYIFMGLMVGMIVAVPYNSRQRKLYYINSILVDVESDYNHVMFTPIQDVYGRLEPDIFMFTVTRGKNRTVSWIMCPKNHEYIMGSLKVHGSPMMEKSELWLEAKVKNRLKEVGTQAYIYWKMSN